MPKFSANGVPGAEMPTGSVSLAIGKGPSEWESVKEEALAEHRANNAGSAAVELTRGSRIAIDDRGEGPLGWQDSANCLGVDPDLFFPERGESTREAKTVCRGCVVRDDCLEFALNNSEKHGIWGGMSERERRRIRRQRAIDRRTAGV
jgi:WhiB family redox-sensing transcriptional regulator